jgi:hypothetical protein
MKLIIRSGYQEVFSQSVYSSQKKNAVIRILVV